MSKIIVVTSVSENTLLLPHFINHYDKLGVDNIIICTHAKLVDQVKTCTSSRKITIEILDEQHDEDFDEWKDHNEDRALIKHNPSDPSDIDYKICVDVDEFHEYPLPLRLLVDRMNKVDEWALCGFFVDRFGINYSTPMVTEQDDIFSQFPLQDAHFSETCGACSRKIMICRSWCELAPGRHHTLDGHYDRHFNVGLCIDQFKVHHFKWTEGIEKRLQGRIDDPTYGVKYKEEAKKELSLLKQKRQFI